MYLRGHQVSGREIVAITLSVLFHAMLLTFSWQAGKQNARHSSQATLLKVDIVRAEKNTTIADEVKLVKNLPNPQAAKNSPPELVPLIPTKSIPAPRYYEISELDTAPEALEPILPVYPKAAETAGVTGRVKLDMLLNEDGGLEAIRVLEATLPGVFDEAALAAFTQKKFKPGLKQGRAVRSHLVVSINFGDD